MRFRKKDYIIFYAIIVVVYLMNLMSPVKLNSILGVFIGPVFPAVILGTITNFIFKKK